nr:hypothetical protein [Tanacetum cinerariifolium]
MSSASSAVTYTFVYIDFELGRVFWGADKELSNDSPPRVIVYRYDGLPMQSVAPPSPSYIPGLEEPHDPDYVSEPIYPEYIPLEDEHVFLVKEQPLPPVDSPTAESPGYVAELDLEEDLEDYEDDEIEDGSVYYPMDGGDEEDNDYRDSSEGDTDVEYEDEEDEDEEEEEEEKHLAPADSVVIIPTVKLVSPPEGTKPVIPPPSTDTTTGARITIWLQASIPLPPEAEVERLLAMPTPPLSLLTSLSPPSAGERLARIASTQALIDAVTAALPSPPLPPLPPPLYIPSHVDRRDDILKTELPPHKKSCLFSLGPRYEEEHLAPADSAVVIPTDELVFPPDGTEPDIPPPSTDTATTGARITIRLQVGYGIRDTWIDPAKTVPELAPMTMGELVDLLMKDMIVHQETIQIVKDEAYAAREAWAHSIGLSQAVHSELQTYQEQVYAHEFQLQTHQTQLQLQSTLIQTQHQLHETRFQMQQAEIAELRETDRRRQVHMAETLRVMGDMRREMGDMQAELLALREQPRRAGQQGGDARVPNHQDAPRDADSHI